MFVSLPEDTLYAVPLVTTTGAQAEMAFQSWSATPERRGPLSLYVHVPFCVSLCQFCGFVTSNKFNRQKLNETVELTIAELSLVVRKLGCQGQRLDAVFFGGGTASVLAPDQVSQLLEAVQKHFSLNSDTEMTFEGDCLTLSRPGYCQAIRDMGFKRLSYGIQTLDQDLRKFLNLRPTPDQLAALYESTRNHFDEVSVDFIYGWPAQSLSHFQEDLGTLLERLNPDAIELFGFESSDASPSLLKLLKTAGAALATSEQLQQQYQYASDILNRHSLQRRGFTKFSRTPPSSTAGYGCCYYGWNEGEVIGVGRGAQSFFGGAMWGNAVVDDRYRSDLQEKRLPIGDFSEYAKGQRENVTWPRRGWILQEKILPAYRKPIEHFIEAGYCQKDEDCISLTYEGWVWVPAMIKHLWDIGQTDSGRAAA